ncbi:MAG TPA: 5-(carboxyamino)imidazole ribonucleotide mutase [Sorangium sp.]|nr:5-(carboxyamino)imidazole ribonucleotide mutase [Sorangium sp.]
MGSDSDFEQLQPSWKILDELEIGYQVRVASAHRTPDVVHDLASNAQRRGFSVVLAAAGGAAHLAGVIAALTTLPVVAMPVANGAFAGVDALLSSVQMPAGVPLASVGVDGARNAGLYAAAILATHDAAVRQNLIAYRRRLHAKVIAADAAVQSKFEQKTH